MQCSVWVSVEVDDEAEVGQMESAIVEAGRQAMRAALTEVVRRYEATHASCPWCGSPASQSQGTVRRWVLTRFGRVGLSLRRQRCTDCGRRFRPASGCLAPLGQGNMTPELAADCALAGASWPYATAARVLRRLSGAQVSHEAVRQRCVQAGRQEAATQQREAEQVLEVTAAAAVRTERETALRAQRQGEPSLVAAGPERLTVGLDGGWLPSREQRGGMEGKVGVIATGTAAVGKHGRQRLTPRRYVATFGTSEQIGMLGLCGGGRPGRRRGARAGGAGGWGRVDTDPGRPPLSGGRRHPGLGA